MEQKQKINSAERARLIIEAAADDCAQHGPDRLAAMTGHLSGCVRVLCAEIEQLYAHIRVPDLHPGLHRMATTIGGGGGSDVKVVVDYEVGLLPGDHRANDTWTIDIARVLIGQVDIAAILSKSQIDDLERDCEKRQRDQARLAYYQAMADEAESIAQDRSAA